MYLRASSVRYNFCFFATPFIKKLIKIIAQNHFMYNGVFLPKVSLKGNQSLVICMAERSVTALPEVVPLI
jgi:hypothetical protein